MYSRVMIYNGTVESLSNLNISRILITGQIRLKQGTHFTKFYFIDAY